MTMPITVISYLAIDEDLRLMKKLFTLIFVSLFFQVSFVAAFELEDFNGAKINLDDKIGQGKWALVMFWAHDCGVCKTEFPIFSDFHSKRDDVEVIAVSIDGQEKKTLAQTFIDTYKPSFTPYLSELTIVAANYQLITEEGFRGTPTFLLFKPDGTLLGNNPGKLSVEALERFIESNS